MIRANKMMNSILMVLSGLFAIGMRTFLKPCGPMEDGTWMNCHKAGTALTVIAVVLLASSLLHWAWENGKQRAFLDLLSAVLCIAALLIPGHVIHLCMMPQMRCRAVMTPGAAVFAVLILIASAVDLILTGRAKE